MAGVDSEWLALVERRLVKDPDGSTMIRVRVRGEQDVHMINVIFLYREEMYDTRYATLPGTHTAEKMSARNTCVGCESKPEMDTHRMLRTVFFADQRVRQKVDALLQERRDLNLALVKELVWMNEVAWRQETSVLANAILEELRK